MTERAKRKGIEIGLGLLTYIIVWAVSFYGNTGKAATTVLFLAPYIILSATTYLDEIKRLTSLKFFDENLLIIVATCGAFAVERPKEAVGAMLLYQAGKLVEELSLSQTKKSIARFIDIRPEYANLKEAGRERVVEPQDLKPKQIIVLKPGEKIPVDAVVTMGTGTIDMKALTGESTPRTVKVGDRIYSGAINLNGVLEARVVKVYNDSVASKIMRLVENANEKKAESVRLADKFARYYTPVAILIALLTCILPPMIFMEAKEEWIFRGMIILVAACPSGLLVSIPMAFLGGIGAAAGQGVLIKGSSCIETLTRVDTFVFDKTGTLTEGVFHVQEIVPYKMTEKELLELAALAETYSSHPIAVSLREAYGREPDKSRVGEVTEYPGLGLCAVVDGRRIFIGNSRLMNRQGVFCHLVPEPGAAVHVAVEKEYAGHILISDTIRKDAGRLIRWLHRRQLAVVMLTGDNEAVAENVAAKLKIESVYAELMPEDKVEQLEEFRESEMEGEKLAFVGDGINDAPVLALSDVGIAMGGLGADAALEAADIILMEDEPSRIINAIRISRATMRAVKQNMFLAAAMKVLLIGLAFFGLITMQNAIIAEICVMLISILNSFWMMKYPE
ncbi:MAG TPA: cadmium-translocating P-type ATPase [Candidatus Mediterraneibacter merdigallinarum]|nr:cadmium-translocating P-type ATPase [Candidatus Mediterraneibacter merdigallinarum]